MDNTTEIFRSYLYTALASKAQMNQEQCEACLGKFDKITKTGASGETAFRVVYSAFGATDVEKECRTVKDAIQNALEKISKDHAGVDKNPLSRLRDLIKRHNASIKKCSAMIDGKESLTDAEIEAVKIRVPSFLNREQLQAFASLKASIKELDVAVKF